MFYTHTCNQAYMNSYIAGYYIQEQIIKRVSNCAIVESVKSYGFSQRAPKGVNEMTFVLLNDVDD